MRPRAFDCTAGSKSPDEFRPAFEKLGHDLSGVPAESGARLTLKGRAASPILIDIYRRWEYFGGAFE
jgi:hypothetical protein